jgi:hypothetical protein
VAPKTAWPLANVFGVVALVIAAIFIPDKEEAGDTFGILRLLKV